MLADCFAIGQCRVDRFAIGQCRVDRFAIGQCRLIGSLSVNAG
jgi:hypothetical protein